MKTKRAKISDGRIDITKYAKKICETCHMIQHTEGVYCNHCQKQHHMCSDCIEKNKEMLKMKPKSIDTIFGNNLEKWK